MSNAMVKVAMHSAKARVMKLRPTQPRELVISHHWREGNPYNVVTLAVGIGTDADASFPRVTLYLDRAAQVRLREYLTAILSTDTGNGELAKP